MNVLLLGSGGREHALAWKISHSKRVTKLYCAPGNAGTATCAVSQDIDILDKKAVLKLCRKRKIDLVVIGPEAPLARGITDVLEAEGIKVCGPSYAASRMESSKIFAKEMMGRCGIPTARFRIFDSIAKAKDYIRGTGLPIVIKADGLASGKGVVVADTEEQAFAAVETILEKKEFGSAGNKILIEECLKGEEVSILVLTDGTNFVHLASSQDHKRIFDGDNGPNTGGMGAYSPAPMVTPKLLKEIEDTILRPAIDGLRSEGMVYKGILYAGIMITDSGPKVLEFNVRFGDPEAQAVLVRLKSDIVDLLYATASGDLSSVEPEWYDNHAVCVVLASGGYPGRFEKGKEVHGIANAITNEGVVVFHAGTELDMRGRIRTTGGRALSVVGIGSNIKEAIYKAYHGVNMIHFENMYYRKDIAYRALKLYTQKSDDQGKKSGDKK
ncbi:MAG: phosphoribosylamine--glycine ligase [Candidatus Omnitrophica bacterium]|nr:phosphoribosylamine--glycine ligase [Candidatus Omnitrophota bacterium]